MKKTINIYIPKGKSVFYANFRMKSRDPVTGIITSRQVNRSTGSPSRATAQSIANKMRDDALLGLFEVTPRLRNDCTIIGKVVERYRSSSQVATLENVIKSFQIVVSESLGSSKDAILKMPVSVLTADLMIGYRDRAGQDRQATSTNTHMRMAKSLFSARAQEHYRGLALPDLTGFLRVSFLKDPTDKRFRRIPDQILADMDKNISALLITAKATAKPDEANQLRNAWATFWLMRRCGLRNDECANLRWEWFEHRDDRIWLALNSRDYWKPKGSEGNVPVASDLYSSLIQQFGQPRPGPEGFVLAGTPTDRYEGTKREVNTFVRPYLPNRTKAAYELRKQWGSEMARIHGIETAAKLLRHRDIKTAWDHYFDDLKLRDVQAL